MTCSTDSKHSSLLLSLSNLRYYTMFTRIAAFTALVLPLLAVATPAPVVRNDEPTTACCASTIPVGDRSQAGCSTTTDACLNRPALPMALRS